MYMCVCITVMVSKLPFLRRWPATDSVGFFLLDAGFEFWRRVALRHGRSKAWAILGDVRRGPQKVVR